MKSIEDRKDKDGVTVAPHWGAWIEITREARTTTYRRGRTPLGCVD